MNVGDLLISWSIRVAMVLFFVAMALYMQINAGQRPGVGLKILWTAGFLLSVAHVAAAFHFAHHWSHSEAYLATAAETRQKLGFAYGAGVYFNYLFLIVWALDVYWIWRSPEMTSKPKQWLIFVGRCFLIFIAFNGVVVFKSGWLRILGALATAALLGVAWRVRMRRTL